MLHVFLLFLLARLSFVVVGDAVVRDVVVCCLLCAFCCYVVCLVVCCLSSLSVVC